MDLHFIPARARRDVVLPGEALQKLPRHITIAVAAQFLSQLAQFKKQLEAAGKSVYYIQGKHARFPGQILGCSWAELAYPPETEAFLYVGDGLFHPMAILLGSEKPLYRYNPFEETFEEISHDVVAVIKKKSKGALLKFLHSKNIGVLLSTKPGQQQMHLALELKERFPDKRFYYLTSNTIDFNQMGNFPFVECFVNTSCNRIIDDFEKFPQPVLNIEDIPTS